MEYQEVLQNARTCMGPYCKACPVCNGQACKNTIPGPGAKGSGTGFARNYQKWQELRVNLDTIGENRPADTSFDFFGHRLALPVMAAPVGAMQLHYGDKYDDLTYNRLLLAACAKAGIVAFTGDGVDPAVMEGATQAIRAQQGCGVPTVKPWDRETLMQKLDLALTADPMAIAMDIDAAGLPFLRNRMPPAVTFTVNAQHTEGEGKITTPATTEREGVKTYVCTVCGEVLRTESVTKLPAPAEPTTPAVPTGDTGDTGLWMGLAALCGMSLAALLRTGKRKEQ